MSDALKFPEAVKQETSRLQKEYPTPEDLPGCMSLFDGTLSCYGTTSQMKTLYRYGHMARCSTKFEEFKFCMTLKGMHPDDKRDAWILRRAEWWANKRLNKSSEDVWDVRTLPIQDYPPPLDPSNSTGPRIR